MSQTCPRCGNQTVALTGSWLNTQMVCLDCQDAEQQHPRYKEAREAELAAIKAGNFNYNPGILSNERRDDLRRDRWGVGKVGDNTFPITYHETETEAEQRIVEIGKTDLLESTVAIIS